MYTFQFILATETKDRGKGKHSFIETVGVGGDDVDNDKWSRSGEGRSC